MIEINNTLAKQLKKTKKAFIAYLSHNNKIREYIITDDLCRARKRLKGCKFLAIETIKITTSKNYIQTN